MAVKPLTFYSHRIGPNPWKTVTVLEELNIPYETIFLDFGAGKNGVEGSDFKKKNPAGRVPLIYDPNTGISLSESNAIAQYLVERHDPSNSLTVTSFPDRHLLSQWLYFQGETQSPMLQRGVVFGMQGDNPAAIEHFQGIIKRTLRTMDDHLMGKTWVVGEKCTIADLAFVNWDDANVLDIAMKGDPEAATMEMREKMFPNWAAWHKKLLERPSVKKMKEAQRVAVSEMK